MEKLEERFKSLEGDILDPKSVLHVDGLLVSSGDSMCSERGAGTPAIPSTVCTSLRETRTGHTLRGSRYLLQEATSQPWHVGSMYCREGEGGAWGYPGYPLVKEHTPSSSSLAIVSDSWSRPGSCVQHIEY